MAYRESWSLITPPSATPALDLAAVKAHIRVDADVTDYDGGLAIYIAAAQAAVEQRLGCALLQQVWQAGFPGLDPDNRLTLARGPNLAVQSVAALVGGAYQTLDPSLYAVRPLAGRNVVAIVKPSTQATPWPVADVDPAAWIVTAQVGWANAAAIPAPIIAAMLLIVGDLFDNRSAKVQANIVENPTVDALLSTYRTMSL